MPANDNQDMLNSIAIIAMGGRFPGAKNVEQFWQNIRDGVESISFFTDEEVESNGRDREMLTDLNFIKARGILDDIELFDAAFFGFSPREAETMDPQQRQFLECAWEVLEKAGYNSENYAGRIGVFGSMSMSSYLFNNLMGNRSSREVFEALIGNDRNHLTTRVSYKLNLKGPSINIQTACSASLVSVHLACQSLLSAECDMALAGGVSITVPQRAGHLYQAGGIYSPDGHCRAFDADTAGIVGGNGLGLVVLKRLEDALKERDNILAVIRGSAINNDGSAKIGYTAPSVEGQRGAIKDALAISGVDPASIGYVETHGTGTILGDPIEIAALTQAYRGLTDKRGYCAVGSVKSNVGHLDSAAGVTGLIKAVLALQHKMIPPTLNVENPNPKIDWANTPFYVSRQLTEWPCGAEPRRAAVSAFGLGGANAHVILEEAPAPESTTQSRPHQLLVLSARTPLALEHATENLVTHLKNDPKANLADIAYTLQVGRRPFSYHRAVVCHSIETAITALENRNTLSGRAEQNQRRWVFMFAGLGDHYPNMGLELYQQESVFREEIDLCSRLLEPELGLAVREALYPALVQPETINPPTTGLDLRKMLGRELVTPEAQALNRTEILQPALFALEYALAKLWMSWGVQPEAMIGYSLGEYVAACLSGVFTLEEALRLVARRARLIAALPEGSMLAISVGEAQLLPFLGSKLSLAAVNGPELTVASGPTREIEKLEATLAATGIACRPLQTGHAFHSTMLEPAFGAMVELAKSIKLNPPKIPYISNLTCKWIKAEEVQDPQYWAKHMCQTVRFSQGLGTLEAEADCIMVEVGPGRTLTSLALMSPKSDMQSGRLVVPSLPYSYENEPALGFMLNSLGKLWVNGLTPKWESLYSGEKRRRVMLPTYPFERQRYWVEMKTATPEITAGAKPELKPDVADWFYLPSWKRSAVSVNATKPETPLQWLVFGLEHKTNNALIRQLEKAGHEVTLVQPAESFAQLSSHCFSLNSREPDNYVNLIAQLKELGRIPERIIHLWSYEPPASKSQGFEAVQYSGYYSLLFLVQALGSQLAERIIPLYLVSNRLFEVESQDNPVPEKAALLAAAQVIPQEHPTLPCQTIEIELLETDNQLSRYGMGQLLAELRQPAAGENIAYRGAHRWQQTFEPIHLDVTASAFQRDKTYLMVGKVGQAHRFILDYLTQTIQAKVIIAGALEGNKGLENILITNAKQDKLTEAEAQFGKIKGVIYLPDVAANSVTISQSGPDSFNPSNTESLPALAELLRGKTLDFCLVLSSLNTQQGGVNQSAVDHFTNAFAANHFRRTGQPWLSVNWNPAETSDTSVLERLISLAGQGITRVIVSRSDINSAASITVEKPEKPVTATAQYARPNLPTAYLPPQSVAEQRIASVWQELLGIRQIGRKDNFFDLGGHSLLGTQLITRLGQLFQLEVPLQALFEAPTVSGLALWIEEMIILELKSAVAPVA